MGAPVRLEAEFFDDPDVDALAELLGYPDRDMAAGKLARLYSWQTEKYTDERPTYAVPRSTLIGIFGVKGPDAMVEAGLATLQDDGLYKIAGSDKPNGRTPGKTRVNWLWLERQAQADRGRKRAASAGDGARDQGRFTSAAPAGDQPATSRKHAGDQPPASSPFSVLRSPDPDLSLTARAGAEQGPPAPEQAASPPDAPESPPRPASSDRWRKLALALHDRWADAGRALTAELGLTAKVGGVMPAPATIDRILAAVAIWAGEAMATDRDLEAVADERMAHLLAVRTAAARVERDVRWWAAPQFWGADSIERDLARDPKRAAAPRDGPRRQSPHAPAPPARTRPLRDL